jgi:hypothetical protein
LRTSKATKKHWLDARAEADSKGRYLSSASNINTILGNDARLKEAFKQNLDGKRYVFKSLPWRKVTTEP